MRLAELSKRISRKDIFLYGHFTNEEIFYLKRDRWKVVWREGYSYGEEKTQALDEKQNMKSK